MSRKSWVPIVFVALVVISVICIALLGAGAYFYVNHVQVESGNPVAARQRFDDARKRFEGQSPMVQIDEHHRPTIKRGAEGAAARRSAPLEALEVMTWDPREDRLIRISIPFWLLRLKTGSSMFSSFGEESIDLTVEDLERHGPGLIFDHEEPGGQRVLVWSR